MDFSAKKPFCRNFSRFVSAGCGPRRPCRGSLHWGLKKEAARRRKPGFLCGTVFCAAGRKEPRTKRPAVRIPLFRGLYPSLAASAIGGRRKDGSAGMPFGLSAPAAPAARCFKGHKPTAGGRAAFCRADRRFSCQNRAGPLPGYEYPPRERRKGQRGLFSFLSFVNPVQIGKKVGVDGF